MQAYLKNTDAAERGAMSPTTIQVYEWLQAQADPATPRQIAEGIGLVKDGHIRPIVYYHLKKLTQLGIVEMVGTRYWAPVMDVTHLDSQVARPMGTEGKGWRRQQKQIEERAYHASRTIWQSRVKTEPNGIERSWACPHCGERWYGCQWALHDQMVCEGCGVIVMREEWTR
jgi:hypothetical protein